MSVPSSVPYPACVYCSFKKPITIRRVGESSANNSISSSAVSTQKKIWRTVRVPASEYTMNRAALNVYTPAVLNTNLGYYGVNWNQSSDRAVPGVVHSNVPSHANSTKQSITRLRPGSTSAAGSGVDIKHGSYDRYLARLKGRNVLRTQAPATAALTPIEGNKTIKYGIAYTTKCLC
jgi:hypothetical protein